MSHPILHLPVDGMSCAACAQRIEKVLNRLPGVEAQVNFASASAQVRYPAGVLEPAALLEAVSRAGYRAQLAADDAPSRVPASEGSGDQRRTSRRRRQPRRASAATRCGPTKPVAPVTATSLPMASGQAASGFGA